MHIFLSFAGQYREIADRLAVGLAQEGHTVFFDRDDLPPAQGYDARIRREIDRTDLVVFLIAPESVRPGAYALTELDYVRKRWPIPSGRVLPVMAAKVPYDALPGYLSAVTALEPRGNLVADVLAAVDRIAQGRRRRLPWALVPVLAVGIGVGVWYLGPGDRDNEELQPCYLWIESSGFERNGAAESGATLSIGGGGRTESFILSASGRTPFQVGIDQLDAWTLKLTDLQGEIIAETPVKGCPREPKEVAIDENKRLVVRPRGP